MQNRLLKPSGRHTRRHLGTLALATVAALALAAPALAAGFKIAVHIANHTPIAGKRWPIELRITHGRRNLSGTVRYQFLFSGVVVRTQPQHGAFRFKHGVYRDQLVFPAQSIGQPLTLRFLVRTRYGREHADWRLEVRK
jgi:hypothetical protein